MSKHSVKHKPNIIKDFSSYFPTSTKHNKQYFYLTNDKINRMGWWQVDQYAKKTKIFPRTNDPNPEAESP